MLSIMKKYGRWLYRRNKLLYQIVGYLIGGGTAALVDMSILIFLTSFVGLWYWYSAAISFIIGGFVNFFINKKITFMNKYKKIHIQYVVFLTVALTSLLWNQFWMYFFVDYVHLNYIIAKIITLWIVFVWSFTMHRHITYGKLK